MKINLNMSKSKGVILLPALMNILVSGVAIAAPFSHIIANHQQLAAAFSVACVCAGISFMVIYGFKAKAYRKDAGKHPWSNLNILYVISSMLLIMSPMFFTAN